VIPFDLIMSKQSAQQAYVKEKLSRPSALEGVSRLKSKPNLGGYCPRTLQRVSLAKWEEDADLEQGSLEETKSSVSVLSLILRDSSSLLSQQDI